MKIAIKGGEECIEKKSPKTIVRAIRKEIGIMKIRKISFKRLIKQSHYIKTLKSLFFSPKRDNVFSYWGKIHSFTFTC